MVQQHDVPRELMASLDTVWSVIRARGLDRRGRMVAVYRNLDGGTVEMECGVEVFGPFAAEGDVQLLTTPGGAAACATHVGSVQRIGETYRLIDEWLQSRGTSPLGVTWEIYGHADEVTGAFDIELFVLMPSGAAAPSSL
jgi:effector-binding domain-containing protein